MADPSLGHRLFRNKGSFEGSMFWSFLRFQSFVAHDKTFYNKTIDGKMEEFLDTVCL